MFDHVIVAHPKDYECLPICIQGILENVSGSSGKIYLVSPTNPNVENVEFVNEKEFDHIVKLSDIRERFVSALPNTNGLMSGGDRSGWIYQQFLKMFSGDVLDTSERYHVVCSDTFFVNDPLLDENIFHYQRVSNIQHYPYVVTLDKVFGEGFTAKDGHFNSHHMLFSRTHFNEMKDAVEKKHDKPLWRACMDCMSYNDGAELSEYIMFANWMINHHPKKCVEVNLLRTDINRLPTKQQLKLFRDTGYVYINSHAYNRIG